MTERITPEQVRTWEATAIRTSQHLLADLYAQLATQMKADNQRIASLEAEVERWQTISENLRKALVQTAGDALELQEELHRLREALCITRDFLLYADNFQKDGRDLDPKAVHAFVHNINVALGDVEFTETERAILRREESEEKKDE